MWYKIIRSLLKQGAVDLEIKGQISEIIYQNEINSYTIAEFETEEELTVIVGYLPFPPKRCCCVLDSFLLSPTESL